MCNKSCTINFRVRHGMEGWKVKLRLVLNASLFRDMQEFRAREIYFTLVMVGV